MYRYLMKLLLAGVFATPVLMIAASGAPALAQGMADDSACVIAGLFGEEFGLCNAYCEAMDCDADTPQASAKACEKVRAKFEAIEGAPELPCLADPPLNTAPVVDLDAVDDCPTDGLCNTTATFVSFGDAVPIAVDVEITDSDSGVITSATVTLPDPPPDGTDETLSLTPAGDSLVMVDLFGGAWNFDIASGELTVIGDGTLAQYAEILQEVVYDNALGAPTTDPDRSITVVVSDGTVDSNTAISAMAVTVGCPCTAFSSDIIIDTDLQTYETVRGARDGCGSYGDNCYNSRSAFDSVQVRSCTRVLKDSTGEFRYHAEINIFVSPPDFDHRTFEAGLDAGGACFLTIGGSRRDRSILSFTQIRSSAVGVKPYQFVVVHQFEIGGG